MRRLTVKYNGALIRVRRSSDNSESDISFNSQGVLDSVSLLNFVGANNGFITKWYDQSGNGYHVDQTTAAFQPKIISSGSLNLINNKPTISFLKSSTQSLSNAASFLVRSTYIVASYTGATYADYDGANCDMGVSTFGILGDAATTSLYQSFKTNYVNGIQTSVTPMNNSLFVAVSQETNMDSTWNGFNIGKQSSYLFRTWDGNISEAFNFSTRSVSDKRLIELNQSKYYFLRYKYIPI